MPILPLIDLLILIGWTSLFAAFVLKAVWLSTSYAPRLFGMSPFDLVVSAGVMLLFALALAARQWVKSFEAAQRAEAQRVNDALDARFPPLPDEDTYEPDRMSYDERRSA